MVLKVYDLEQPRIHGMPIHPVHKPVGFTYVLHRKHSDAPVSNKRSSASGVLMMTEHTGTHIDALCHQALNHELNGIIKVTPEIETPYGFTVHGIEKVRPIVTRGILLDVAGCKGMSILPERYRISTGDLQKCCEDEGLKPRRGDVMLVRTGYGTTWNAPGGYELAAGVSLEATQWAASEGVCCVGADNMAWEVDDGQIDEEMGVTLPCHVLLLVKKGIYIIENLRLEELSFDKTYEFLFVCSPLKIVGATGSPVRPIAVTGVDGFK